MGHFAKSSLGKVVQLVNRKLSALGLSVLLHLLLFSAVLLAGMPSVEKKVEVKRGPVIQAHAVDGAELRARAEKKRKIREQAERKERERKAAIKRKENEKKKAAEEKRLKQKKEKQHREKQAKEKKAKKAKKAKEKKAKEKKGAREESER